MYGNSPRKLFIKISEKIEMNMMVLPFLFVPVNNLNSV